MMVNKQSGMTLLETMLAMSLGACLSWVVVLILADVSRLSLLTESLTDLMDRQSWLFQILPKHIQQAGLSDCTGQVNKQSWPIEIFLHNQAVPKWLTQKKSQTDALIVSSCRKYRGKARWVRTAYYVAKTSWHDRYHRPIYALYQKVEGGRREALILNILDIKIKTFYQSKPISSSINLDDLSFNLLSITLILESQCLGCYHYSTNQWDGKSYKVPKGVRVSALPIWVSLRNSIDV
ncbi:MAG: hypothetical protein CL816_01990 [Coxiellaceae bacterium]|nr:hypothetical protein [Coxiellaceae bacterium]|tara:strand:+ start:5518 stop:6225 length:708 start_codon:yes stop_codon:yes gene_type:complete